MNPYGLFRKPEKSLLEVFQIFDILIIYLQERCYYDPSSSLN